MKKKYTVLGMNCAACSSAVERALLSCDVVGEAEVNLLANTATVHLPEGPVDEQPLFDAVRRAGYTLLPYTEQSVRKKEQKDDARLSFHALRLIISVVFLLPLFYLAMGHMFHWPLPASLDNHKINTVLQMILLSPIVGFNYSYFTVGYRRIFSGHPNMDSLIALGATASIGYSIYGAVCILFLASPMHSSPMLYFESAGMILTFITIGRFLEARSKKKTGEAIAGLLALAPEEAVVEKDGKEETLPSALLQVGDRVVVRPGAYIPADGRVVSGESSIDESSMTGESVPRDVSEGDPVRAGTVNLSGRIVFTAEKVAGDTTLSKMVALVEEASAGKAPVGRLADKIAGIFVPVIIGIALTAAGVWAFLSRDVNTVVKVAVSVLVIACPCSLGLATPAAIMAGTGKGAELGVLFRSAAALEECGKVDTVVFDKTGTLTKGRPQVRQIIARRGGEKELLAACASLESASEHPIARAICAYAEEQGVALCAPERFEALPGRGVRGVLDGKEFSLFSLARAQEAQPGFALSEKEKDAVKGKTAVALFEGGVCTGLVALEDALKEDAKKAVEILQKQNLTCILLSGDKQDSAELSAAQAGIDRVFGEVLPEQKQEQIALLRSEGKKVAMVGDGINDAPSLAFADVGIAMGQGTDIAIESADVVLMNSHPTGVGTAIALSRQTMRIIKQNLFFAFFYNCIGVGLAVAGIADPMIAAAAMSLSSFCVLSNALRLRRFSNKKLLPDQAPDGEANDARAPREPIKEKSDEKESLMKKATLKVDGMMCMHCVAHVKKALEAIDGVTSAEVSLEQKSAVVYSDVKIDPAVLKKAVEDAGYTVVSIA